MMATTGNDVRSLIGANALNASVHTYIETALASGGTSEQCPTARTVKQKFAPALAEFLLRAHPDIHHVMLNSHQSLRVASALNNCLLSVENGQISDGRGLRSALFKTVVNPLRVNSQAVYFEFLYAVLQLLWNATGTAEEQHFADLSGLATALVHSLLSTGRQANLAVHV